MIDLVNSELRKIADKTIQELADSDCEQLDAEYAEYIQQLYMYMADPYSIGPGYDDYKF